MIEGLGKYTTSNMLWFGAEDAECWGLMKWSAEDTSNDGIACFLWAMMKNDGRKPIEVTAKNADAITCRMSAGTSLIYISNDSKGQGFSDAYRNACRRIAADPKTPKYAAIDIIMWLTLTDPDVLALKPGTLMIHILDKDEDNMSNCWKCQTIIGMTMGMHEGFDVALTAFQRAKDLAKRDTGSVPEWLTSRADIFVSEAAKQNH